VLNDAVVDDVLVLVAFLLSDTDAFIDFDDELVSKADFVCVCENDFDTVLAELRDRTTVSVMDMVCTLLTDAVMEFVFVRVAFGLPDTDTSSDCA